ncbi:nuclear transport factor 2 family protein [Streptodolium elevatio]|uniref:Nuclear transport factor 2 family protein n=1 Tax=Streptodolium elevatio TaxID=3157996 RepID=A0ABV3DAI0_9ACTN
MMPQGPKDVVTQAVDEMFGKRDPDAVARLVTPGFRQHSALLGDGPEALRAHVAALPETFSYTCARLLSDGDLVLMHGTYHGLGPRPLVAFDLFRVADGRIAEHWDALTPEAGATVSGRSQTDGPTLVTRPGQRATSRQVGETFLRTVLIDREYDRIAEFVHADDFAQHNPGTGDGIAGLGAASAAMRAQGLVPRYDRVHRVVAEGEFVYTLSSGSLGGSPYAFHDLFRVDGSGAGGGFIVEHWDVLTPVPPRLPHDNGMF